MDLFDAERIAVKAVAINRLTQRVAYKCTLFIERYKLETTFLIHDYEGNELVPVRKYMTTL